MTVAALAPDAVLEAASALLERAIDGTPGTLAVTFAEPTLVLGSAQPEATVDRAACAAGGLHVVRRGSGGGAVLCDPGLLEVDVALPAGHPLLIDDVSESYRFLGSAWLAALASLGIEGRLVTVTEARALPAPATRLPASRATPASPRTRWWTRRAPSWSGSASAAAAAPPCSSAASRAAATRATWPGTCTSTAARSARPAPSRSSRRPPGPRWRSYSSACSERPAMRARASRAFARTRARETDDLVDLLRDAVALRRLRVGDADLAGALGEPRPQRQAQVVGLDGRILGEAEIGQVLELELGLVVVAIGRPAGRRGGAIRRCRATRPGPPSRRPHPGSW